MESCMLNKRQHSHKENETGEANHIDSSRNFSSR